MIPPNRVICYSYRMVRCTLPVMIDALWLKRKRRNVKEIIGKCTGGTGKGKERIGHGDGREGGSR